MTRRTFTAWAFCALLAAGLLLSALFLAGRTRHICTGGDCPVCACLQAAARQLHAGGRPAARAGAAALTFAPVLWLGRPVRTRPGATLVTHKVRLDN